MSGEQLIAAVDRSYIDWWRVWAGAVAGGVVEEHDGVLLAMTGAPQEWWNVAFVTRALDDPAARLRSANEHFDARSQRYIMRIRDGLDPASEAAAEQLGLGYIDTLPGMTLASIPDAPAPPGGLEIRTANSAEDMRHAARINAEAYGMEHDTVVGLLPERLARHPAWETYIGYVDGQPATTSSLLVTDGIAGVYFVATLDAYRRRGFGEAVTWHTVRRGAERGCSLATLQASEMGLPVYQGMGFRTVTGYKTFVRPDLRS